MADLARYGPETTAAAEETTIQVRLQVIEKCLSDALATLSDIAPRPEKIEPENLHAGGIIATARRLEDMASTINQRVSYLRNTLGTL